MDARYFNSQFSVWEYCVSKGQHVVSVFNDDILIPLEEELALVRLITSLEECGLLWARVVIASVCWRIGPVGMSSSFSLFLQVSKHQWVKGLECTNSWPCPLGRRVRRITSFSTWACTNLNIVNCTICNIRYKGRCESLHEIFVNLKRCAATENSLLVGEWCNVLLAHVTPLVNEQILVGLSHIQSPGWKRDGYSVANVSTTLVE